MILYMYVMSQFNCELVLVVVVDFFCKFLFWLQFCNLVMFVVFLCSLFIIGLWVQVLVGYGEVLIGFIFVVSLWLWFILLFVNFVEVLVEGCGKVQVDVLCSLCKDVLVKKLVVLQCDVVVILMFLVDLCVGDVVLVQVGDILLGDGEVIVGVVSVNESVIIGEFVLVICEVGGDCSVVIGGI